MDMSWQPLHKVELDSTFCNECGNAAMIFSNTAQCNTPRNDLCNLSRNVLCSSVNQLVLASPLWWPLRDEFQESLHSVKPLVLQCSIARFKPLQDKLHETLPSVTPPTEFRGTRGQNVHFAVMETTRK